MFHNPSRDSTGQILRLVCLRFSHQPSVCKSEGFLRQQLKRLENCAHRVDRWLTVKSQLIAIVTAVVLVGCGESEADRALLRAAGAGALLRAGAGDIAAVKQHLAAGVDVNVKGSSGGTPLHYATSLGHTEVAELLIAEGADVNAKDDRGRTPLHFAAFRGHKEVAALLIAKGADVNAKAKGDWTPLYYAALYGHKEIVELLIAEGADVNAKDVDGDTPLDMATHPKNPKASTETAELLRKHGGKTGEELKAEGK